MTILASDTAHYTHEKHVQCHTTPKWWKRDFNSTTPGVPQSSFTWRNTVNPNYSQSTDLQPQNQHLWHFCSHSQTGTDQWKILVNQHVCYR